MVNGDMERDERVENVEHDSVEIERMQDYWMKLRLLALSDGYF